MNALAMVQRCGRHQVGERASAWATRATVSSEGTWGPAVQVYLPEDEVGGETRALPEPDTSAWA